MPSGSLPIRPIPHYAISANTCCGQFAATDIHAQRPGSPKTGKSQIPDLMRGIGTGVREFNDAKESVKKEIDAGMKEKDNERKPLPEQEIVKETELPK